MNLSSVNEGKYPHKPLFRTRAEKWIYGGMIGYSCLVVFYVLQYYTWGGQ